MDGIGSKGQDEKLRPKHVPPGNNANTSNRQVVTDDTETKVISNIVDSVHPSLVHVGVGALNPSVDVAALLLGRVDVLVAIGNVACLVLGLELAAGHRCDWSRFFRQLVVLGVSGCVLSVDDWRDSTEWLLSCHWAGGERAGSQGGDRGAEGKPVHH